MISFTPFWRTLGKRKISTYALVTRYKINGSTIDRIKNNHNFTLLSIGDLCEALQCPIEDIVEITYGAKETEEG